VPEEELDAAKSNGAGSSRKLPDILEKKEILAKLFFCDLIGRFMVVFGKLAHCPDIHFLSCVREAPELKIVNHSLSELSHGDTSLEFGLMD
jgi:hypothetical protein